MAFIAESSTARLMGGSEPVFSPNLLSEAWKLSCSLYKSGHDNRSYARAVVGKTVVFAFCGSLDPNPFKSTATKFKSTATKYGEYQIDPKENIGFLDGLKGGNDQTASVHGGALDQFMEIWNKSAVQKEAGVEYEKGNNVVFTGHSMGGAIAALATLWMLEKQRQPGPLKSVFCITFGFPLIGDEILARIVRRKKWADQFCHVVLRRDAFSRILLAPSISVSKPLDALIPYWKRSLRSVADSIGSIDTPMAEAFPAESAEFVDTVIQHCCSVANYTSAAKMNPNNSLIAALKSLVKLSPFRPFGHYLFCSSSGGIWIENHFAVLPILYYALQTLDANPEDFILEHVRYGHILPTALLNIVKLEELSDLPLSDVIYQDSKIATQLDALGLGIQNCQARLSLRAAGQVLKQQSENVSYLEKEYPIKMEKAMEELEDYRLQCLTSTAGIGYCIGYYDAFKRKQRRDQDFRANLKRLELAGWWDEIIQNKFYKDELPDDFQCNKDWIRRGTHYRLLVEPLDIANFYRLGKNEDSGPYLKNGRPSRYTTLQKWLENDKENQQPQPAPAGIDQSMELTQNSLIWAHVEEISILQQKNNYDDAKRTELEKQVKDSSGLCMKDLWTGESTFKLVVDWLWKNMTLEQQEASPFKIFYGQSAPQN